MRIIILLVVCFICFASCGDLPEPKKQEDHRRFKRQTYFLPAGVTEPLTSEVRSTFVCSEPGYYADVDNNCEIFHICDLVFDHGGPEMRQYSFACGNKTIFNQFTMTCDFVEDSVGCEYATTFFDINRRIGTNKETPIHTEQDVAEALKYTPQKLKFYNQK